jgi:hypothetical protein
MTAMLRGSLIAAELGTIAQLVPQLTAGRTLPLAVPPNGIASSPATAAATATVTARARFPIVFLRVMVM